MEIENEQGERNKPVPIPDRWKIAIALDECKSMNEVVGEYGRSESICRSIYKNFRRWEM